MYLKDRCRPRFLVTNFRRIHSTDHDLGQATNFFPALVHDLWYPVSILLHRKPFNYRSRATVIDNVNTDTIFGKVVAVKGMNRIMI